MTSAKSAGRTVGTLVLLHIAAGLTLPFILVDQVRQPPGFLENAAGSSGQVRAAVLLLFVGSAVAIGIAVAALPVFRRYSSAIALWLVALAVAAFSLQAVDNGALLSMLSLSQEYAKVGAAKTELFQTLGGVVGSARKWTHYTYLLVLGAWLLLLFSSLYRFRLVPRALAVFGLSATMLQMAAITLRGLLGYPPETRLGVPLGFAYVSLAVWLILKGFDEQHRPLEPQAHGAGIAGR